MTPEQGELEAFSTLVGRIYDAILKPSAWPEVLDAVAAWAGTGTSTLSAPSLWRYTEGLAFLDLVSGAEFSPGSGPARGDGDFPFQPQEWARLSLLLPHVSRALGILILLRDKERLVDTATMALERIPQAIALMGPGGAVYYANPPARRILAAQDGLALQKSIGGDVPGLWVADPGARDRVIRGLQQAASGAVLQPRRCSEGITVPRGSGRCPYVLRFISLGLAERAAQAQLLAFFADPEAPLKVEQAFLVSTYGLTRAEGMVVDGLYRGEALEEVARVLEVSLNTLKTQEKEVFDKLGVNSRAAMTALLARLDALRVEDASRPLLAEDHPFG